MREIKFRIWYCKSMSYPRIQDTFIGRGNVVHMQYTGLKDKKDVEIYEGDTVYATTRGEQFETKFAVIRWSDYLKCMVVYSKDTDIDDCLPIGRFYELEVIGNIYENKDLLKGE